MCNAIVLDIHTRYVKCTSRFTLCLIFLLILIMVQLSGIYNNGNITLDRKVSVKRAVKVIVTFMDEDVTVEKERATSNDFSFSKGREVLKDLKSSLSEAVIEERRSEL